jgi:hypothetical protein
MATSYSTTTIAGLQNRIAKADANIEQCEARIARGDLGAPEGYVMVKGRRQVCFQIEGTLNLNRLMRADAAAKLALLGAI